jgi:hypothetical protein
LEIHETIIGFLGGNRQSRSSALPGEVAGRAALPRRRLVFARVQTHERVLRQNGAESEFNAAA